VSDLPTAFAWIYGLATGAAIAVMLVGLRYGRDIPEKKQPDLTDLFIDRLNRENEDRKADAARHEKSPR